MTWRHDALCADKDPRWLVENPTPQQQRQMALICAACPVRSDCRAEAEAWRKEPVVRQDFGQGRTRPFGVWGGVFYGGSDRPIEPYVIKVEAA